METKNSYAERLGPMSLLFSSIFDANQYLYLPNTCAAMAITYLQNYFRFTQKNDLDPRQQSIYLTAVMYLSCKVSENHRSIRDIYNVITIMNNSDISLGDLDKSYVTIKPLIIDAEHQILRIMKFQVEIDLPHRYMLNIARYLRLSVAPLNISWSLLNDSMQCMEFSTTEPHILAVGCVFTSISLCSMRSDIQLLVEENKFLRDRWYEEFDVSVDQLVLVTKWLLDCWQKPKMATILISPTGLNDEPTHFTVK